MSGQQADLSACFSRVLWAGDALRSLDQAHRVWMMDAELERLDTEYRSEAGIYEFRYWAAKPPSSWSIDVGNIVHQLRCALDNLVWQLVIACGNTPRAGGRGNAYPIYNDEPPKGLYYKEKNQKLHGLSDAWIDVIDSTQPYRGSGWGVTATARGWPSKAYRPTRSRR